MEDDANPFSEMSVDQAAPTLLGKYVLIGVTYCDSRGNETHQKQLHGVIEAASDQGIVVALRGVYEGKTWNMPPDVRGFRRAEPGRYTLHDTNEEVKDPDYTVVWTVEAPEKH